MKKETILYCLPELKFNLKYLRITSDTQLRGIHFHSEIELESGFMSIQYFNKVFKKSKNCLPSTYRKRYYKISY